MRSDNMKRKLAISIIAASLFLGACDAGKDDVIKDIKIDLSTEYKVPISEVKVETVDYGISKFTTNQFKVTIKSKGISLYLVAKSGEGDNFRRIPVE
jgi:protein involved in sex pheromone biosynthesis